MIEVTTNHETRYASQTMQSRFEYLPAKAREIYEFEFSESLRRTMTESELCQIVFKIIGCDTTDLIFTFDERWEAFLKLTEPRWKDEAIKELAELHDDDEEDGELPEGFACNDHDGLS